MFDKTLKFYPEDSPSLHFYSEVFWRAYLGNDVYSLYRVLCSFLATDYGDGHETIAPGKGGFSMDLLTAVLNCSSADEYQTAWSRLHDERIVILWVDRFNEDRIHVEYPLPLLSPLQVDALPKALQEHHRDYFLEYLRLCTKCITYYGDLNTVTRSRSGWNVDAQYDYWLEHSDYASFIPLFDPNEVEKREEKAAQMKRDKVRRTLTASDKQVILDRDGRICRYCGDEATAVDHIIPVIQGGDNDPENLAAACVPCNSKKNGRTPEEAGMILRPIPA